MEKFVYTLIWQGITLEITYWPVRWANSPDIEVRSISPAAAPLPITETGFRTISFAPTEGRLSEADVVGSIADWLDAEAQSPAWLDFVELCKQGELF